MQSMIQRKMKFTRAFPYVASGKEEADSERTDQVENVGCFTGINSEGIELEVQPELRTISHFTMIKENQNPPNNVYVVTDFVASLKMCAQKKDLQKGSEIHNQLIKLRLLDDNIFICTTLISMYAKCGALQKAQELFDELPVQNTATWNALIAGYARHGCSKEALKQFERMRSAGFEADMYTFSCVLVACSRLGALDMGKEIHEKIAKEGLLNKDIVLANGLIDMYAKCGALDKAREVFSDLPVCSIVTWNALVAGYSQQGHFKEALRLYEQILSGGLSPDAVTFVCTLGACGSLGDFHKGQELHAQIVKENLARINVVVANALVDMYGKCGALTQAQGVFDDLPFKNVVLWTALIAGYAQNGRGKEALQCFKQMQLAGFPPDAATLSCVLKACSMTGALDSGNEIHAQIRRDHCLETNTVISNALIDMYAKCGELEKAQEVFNKLPSPDVVAWTTLIGAYAQHKHGDEALGRFARMQLESISPDGLAFACSLKACCSIKTLAKGLQIHSQIIREHSMEKHLLVFNSLIEMYSRCGALTRAQGVFDELLNRNVVSWNALLSGLIQWGHCRDAVLLFEQMLSTNLTPDVVTYACILKALGDIGDIDRGQEIHGRILREHHLDEHVVLANALVDMYAKCGAFALARDVFDELVVRDLYLWTALTAGYVEHGYGEEAVSCFEQMQVEGFYPDAVTFALVLKACASMGAVYRAQTIHTEILKHGILDKDLIIGIALVDMYANCGMLAEAHMLFDKLQERDVVLWSALMVGYAQFGKEETVLDLFDRMVEEGVRPDSVTFTIILNTCSHRGLLDTGQMYFEIINRSFGIVPTVEHYSIMIDLFGRAGHLDKAVALIERSPVSTNLTMWHTLLGACRKWTNAMLGKWVFNQLHEIDGAAYVCLSNILEAADKCEMYKPKFLEAKVDPIYVPDVLA